MKKSIEKKLAKCELCNRLLSEKSIATMVILMGFGICLDLEVCISCRKKEKGRQKKRNSK